MMGVGGHISVGGTGAVMRKFGITVDNVVDATVVVIDRLVLDRLDMGEDRVLVLSWLTSFNLLMFLLLQHPAFRGISNQNPTQLVTKWQEIGPKLDENLFLRAVPQAQPMILNLCRK